MGSALFIVLERPIPGFDATVNGKALSHASKGLDRITEKLGVKSLMEFCSMDLGEATDLLGDLGGDADELPSEQWFSAEEGLRTVEAIQTHLRRRDEALPHLSNVVADLDGFARVLRKAQEAGVRWHLQVDF